MADNIIRVLRQFHKRPTTAELVSEDLIRAHDSYEHQTAEGYAANGDALFNAFMKLGFSYPGQAAQGYGVAGAGGGIEVAVDFGKLFLPGFATAEVKASGDYARSSETVLVTIRQSIIGNSSGAKPVCFIAAQGKLNECSVSLGASIGVKASVGHSDAGTQTMMTEDSESKAMSEAVKEKHGSVGGAVLEKLAVGASAEASLSAGISYSGEFLHVRDPAPSWFSSANSQELKELFGHYVAPAGTRQGTKERIKLFLRKSETGVLQNLLPKLGFWTRIQKAVTKGNIPFEDLMQALGDAMSFLAWADYIAGADPSYLRNIEKSISDIDIQLARSWAARRFNKSDKRTVKNQAMELFSDDLVRAMSAEKGLSGYASLEEIKGALERVREAIKLPAQNRRLMKEKISLLYKHAHAHREKEYSRETPTIELGDGIPSGLCFLNLVGHKPEASASVKASAGLTATSLAKFAATAEAGITISKKFTNYRLQHYQMSEQQGGSGSKNLVVFTQDTRLTYTQCSTKLTATAVASVVASKDLLAKDGKPRQYEPATPLINTMLYQSAYIAWTPPPAGVETVQTQPGTGLVRAMSVSLEGFNTLVKGSDALGLSEQVAKAIGVGPDVLRGAMSSFSFLADMDPKGLANAILIEATFSTPSKTIPVSWMNGEPKLSKDAATKLNESVSSLESIRIRYRMADNYSQSKSTTFQLGIPKTPVKVGIKLKSVADAGSSALVDLGIHWFGARSSLNAPLVTQYPEDVVPSAIIFHQ
ncbi:MAG: hypothetical protein HOI23_06410 [Deltaproteobacteria bacterium]|jgi:hypothetical protein|nr:hypothetical protein [Deltaproteobacteria bacterium]MBT6431732.1 hypothetical protein [Deltaproteobacteria bacterium]MBT6489427.1 hypothetical protein [Deltaproteobacteria bacterium]